MRNCKVNQKGFTLVEVIVVVALITMVLGLAGTIILSSGNIFNKNVDANISKQIGDSVLNYLEDELLYSTSVNTSIEDEDKEFILTSRYAFKVEEGRLFQYDENSLEFIDFYGEEFYNNLSIRIEISDIELPLITLAVTVFDSHRELYTNQTTIKLLNYNLFPADFLFSNEHITKSNCIINYDR